jgi:MFS family permease
MCVDGLLFALTLYTQKAEGYSALQFGAVTAVMTVCAAGAAGFAQRAVTRFGAGRVAGAGMLLLTLTGGAFAVATAVDGSLVLLIAGMVVFGLGMGCAFTSGSVAALEGVEEGDAGVAAAVQNISFGTGTTLGVSILSTVVGAAAGHGGAVVTGAALAGAARAAFVAAAAIAVAGLIALSTLSLRGARAAYALGR